MDEPNIYESTSDENRAVIEETDQGTIEYECMEQDDQKQKVAAGHCRNKPERKVCRCGSGREPKRESKKESRRTRKQILSQNPFIIYYLELYYKNPNKHVTEVARQAGKEWCAMSNEDRQKYICLAERVRRRRKRKNSKRRREC